MFEPAVSILTPSYRRESLLRRQYPLVLAQSVADFEWLILDDSPEPSAFFKALSDPRIRYTHHAGGKLSIGAKRNLLAEQARAPLLAHFDDDDYYAPDYLMVLMACLAKDGADIAKLSGWFVYAAAQRALGYWNTIQTRGLHFRFSSLPILPVVPTEEQSRAFETHYAGFGFTYVYRKTVWCEVPFPDADFNEDYAFASAAMAKGCRLSHFADRRGLALHILRDDNTSICLPQFVLPEFLLERLFPPAVAALIS